MVVLYAVVVQLAKLVAKRLPLVVGPFLLAEEYTVSPTMRFNLARAQSHDVGHAQIPGMSIGTFYEGLLTVAN
eukprot:330706-Prymnesium_polylepis.2